MNPVSNCPLLALLLRNALANPTRDVLCWVDTEGRILRLQGDALLGHTLVLASSMLDQGLQPAQVVALQLQDPKAFALAFCATLLAGGVAFPMVHDLPSAQREAVLRQAKAALWIGDLDAPTTLPAWNIDHLWHHATGRRGRERAFPPRAPEDPAYLLFTSGSSGHPRGVLHAHRVLQGRTPIRDGWTGLDTDDRVMVTSALSWSYGLGVGFLDALRWGATPLVLSPQTEADAWPQWAARWGCTVLATVPGWIRRFLRTSPQGWTQVTTLTRTLSAGEALPDTLREAWTHATAAPVYEALGMTECSTYVSSGPSAPPRPGLVGKIQPGRKIVVLPDQDDTLPCAPGQEGVLAIHQDEPGLMLGYLETHPDDDARWRGPYFLTGDHVRVEADGYLRSLGRKDHQLNPGGYRVSALEIEGLLTQHPAVDAALVFERPLGGNRRVLAALLVGHSPGDCGWDAWCQAHLAKHQRPRWVRWLDALPTNPNGKVDRAAIVTWAAAQP